MIGAMYCIQCGYDLRATPLGDYNIGQCPECGRGCDPNVPETYNPIPPEKMIRGFIIWMVILAGFIVIIIGAVTLRMFDVVFSTP